MRRIGIAATAAAALTVIALVAMWAVSQPTEAATGDGLRTIIADRTGTACASIDVNGNHSGVGVGLAFDGTNLLITCEGDNTVTVIDPADGSQFAAHFLTGASSLGAIAYDAANNRLWGCSASNTVGTIDLAFNSFTMAFNSGGCFDGLAYDGSDDTIWASADASTTLRHYQTDGTQIGGDINLTGKLGGYGNSGIAVGGTNLYLANNGGSQIYQCDKGLVTCTLMSTFQRRLEDLECDNVTFAPLGAIWSIDAYDNVLNAWEIPAGTCAFGGAAQPATITLDPPTATNTVGEDHTVTATVLDQGDPQAGLDVTFTITDGPNAGGTATDTTDASGEATFTYTGDGGVGTDTIEACFVEAAPTPTPTPTPTPQPPAIVEQPAPQDQLATPQQQQGTCATATKTWVLAATPVPSPAALPPTGGQPSGGSGSLPWLAAIGAFALMSGGAWLAYQRRHAR